MQHMRRPTRAAVFMAPANAGPTRFDGSWLHDEIMVASLQSILVYDLIVRRIVGGYIGRSVDR